MFTLKPIHLNILFLIYYLIGCQCISHCRLLLKGKNCWSEKVVGERSGEGIEVGAVEYGMKRGGDDMESDENVIVGKRNKNYGWKWLRWRWRKAWKTKSVEGGEQSFFLKCSYACHIYPDAHNKKICKPFLNKYIEDRGHLSLTVITSLW